MYAMNGTEALEKVKSESSGFDFVGCYDARYGRVEVAGRLKVEPEQAEIPIIFLTALNDSASVVKGFQLGANDFISKPFRREELLTGWSINFLWWNCQTDYFTVRPRN